MKEKNGHMTADDIEVVYKNVVYNGFGHVKEKPIHIIVPEAYSSKRFAVSAHISSGLRVFLHLNLPPYTSKSFLRREQMHHALLGATGELCIQID